MIIPRILICIQTILIVAFQFINSSHIEKSIAFLPVSCVIYFLFESPTCISIDRNVYYKNSITQIDPFHYVMKVAKCSNSISACAIAQHYSVCVCKIKDSILHVKKTGPQFQSKLYSDVLGF